MTANKSIYCQQKLPWNTLNVMTAHNYCYKRINYLQAVAWHIVGHQDASLIVSLMHWRSILCISQDGFQALCRLLMRYTLRAVWCSMSLLGLPFRSCYNYYQKLDRDKFILIVVCLDHFELDWLRSYCFNWRIFMILIWWVYKW